jgi:hypothetical protein
MGVNELRELVEAAVTAVSVLGGAMAYQSGYAAARALSEGLPPEAVSQQVNQGIADGFSLGSPMAAVALILLAWS